MLRQKSLQGTKSGPSRLEKLGKKGSSSFVEIGRSKKIGKEIRKEGSCDIKHSAFFLRTTLCLVEIEIVLNYFSNKS